MSMGTTAVLDTGDVEIVVTSRHVEPNDPGCLTSVGIVAGFSAGMFRLVLDLSPALATSNGVF